MYESLLFLHSLLRWAVVLSVAVVLVQSLTGWWANRPYTRADAIGRAVATSVSHTQLLLGFALYVESPITAYFRTHTAQALAYPEMTFFGLVHLTLMLIGVVVLTIGSSKGKRAPTDRLRHRTVAVYFLLGAVLIFCAIPWPFSPLAQRPLWRVF